jgi:single-strand DNA-binding protein
MNNFTQLVRIGRDAETRFTQAGKPVTGFSAAYDVGWGDNKRTEWLDCSWWGDRGQKLAEHLTKGAQIIVQGAIGLKEYDGKDGKVVKLALDVSDVQFAGSKSERQESGGGRSSPRRETQAASGNAGIADDDLPPF